MIKTLKNIVLGAVGFILRTVLGKNEPDNVHPEDYTG